MLGVFGGGVVGGVLGAAMGAGIGELNPFRYRGYYYDSETELYYLQARYYDPTIGRFISQDSIDYAEPETINGINLYAYCGNNPVMNVDPTGKFGLTFLLVSMLVGFAIGGVLAAHTAVESGLSGGKLAAAIFAGALFGAATSLAFAMGGAALTTGLVVGGKLVSGVALFAVATLGTGMASAVKYGLDSYAYDRDMSVEGYFTSFATGCFEGITNFVAGGLAGLLGFYEYAGAGEHNYIVNLIRKPWETLARLVLFSLPSSIIRSYIRQRLEN